jgi:hypothetical protein
MLSQDNLNKLIGALKYGEDFFSAGLSPSSTAALLMLDGVGGQNIPEELKRDLTNYCKKVYSTYGNNGYPTTHSSEAAQLNWFLSARNLVDGVGHPKFSRDENLKLAELVGSVINTNGAASWGGGVDGMQDEMPDLDGSASAFFNVVNIEGMIPNPRMFLQFRNEDGTYWCFVFERNPASSAIANSIIGLQKYIEKYPSENADMMVAIQVHQELLKQLVKIIKDSDKKLQDKWHTTWTYIFSRLMTIKALYRVHPEIISNQIAVMKKNFYENDLKGFGQKSATPLETSYAQIGLINFLRYIQEGQVPGMYDLNEIGEIVYIARESALSLAQMLMNKDFILEPRWISKDLYAPLWDFGAFLSSLKASLEMFEYTEEEREILKVAIECIPTLIHEEIARRNGGEYKDSSESHSFTAA